MQIEKSRVDEIGKLHSEIIGHLKTSLSKAIRIGELLSEQKESLQHGEFGQWVQDNLPFTDRTARNYMRVFREKDRFKTETVSDLKSAYRLLAPPKEDKDTLAEFSKLYLELESVLPRLRREINKVNSLESAYRIETEVFDYTENLLDFVFDYMRDRDDLSAELNTPYFNEFSKFDYSLYEMQLRIMDYIANNDSQWSQVRATIKIMKPLM